MESKFDYNEERNADLMQNFKALISKCGHIHMPTVYKQLVRLPARRFWVSEKRAAVIVGRMMKGDDLSGMRPTRAEMHREIFKRTMELRKHDGDDTDESLIKTVSEVVQQPAPKFYMTENAAKAIICRLNRRERRRRRGLRE